MRALLDNFAVVNDENEVGIAHGGETVRDDYRGAAVDYRVYGGLYLLLRYRVDRCCRLVEHEDARVGEDRAGEGQQLLFAGGEHVAALADVGLKPVFKLIHHALRRDKLQRAADILVGRVRVAVEQVLAHGAGEEVRRLKDVAYRGVQPELRALACVAPVDEDAAGRRLIEAADEVHERGFARARLADDGDVRAEWNIKAEVLENIFVAVGVFEADVVKFNVALYRFPVLALRVEAVTVFLDNLRGVNNI